MRLVVPLVLLTLVAPAALADDEARGVLPAPIDDPAPTPPLPLPGEDEPAAEAPAEGIWAWVGRLEGEVISQAALRALEEQAEARFAEGALIDALGAPDVPQDLYRDPLKALEVDALRLSEIDEKAFDIPLDTGPEVQRWMRYFLGPGRKHYQRYLGRSTIYLPMMKEKLRAAGLPEDLVFLSMIESGFNSHALSHAGAGGLWQFMPATGRMYDLRVDWWVDDRRDPIKATDAAVAHLADLHKMFKGDWLLAWCAYNAGPGRVRRAMNASGSTDFWVMSRAGHLPSETANYPPKLMAAAIIYKNAERYGFSLDGQPELDVQTVPIDGAASLETLARCADMTVEELQYLNPGLRRSATPSEGYALSLPSAKVADFKVAWAKVPASERVDYQRHTVAKGETLGRIAARYGVTSQELVRANNLRDANRIVVGMSLIVPRPGEAAGAAEVARSPAVASAASSDEAPADRAPPSKEPVDMPAAAAKATTHTVVAGDALSIIARTYGVSTAELRTWNSLSGDTIQPGQKLRVSASGASSSASADRRVRYEVAKGDTLSTIAARFGVSTAELQSWNGLKDASHIRVGQVLEVRRTNWREYTVRSGDSLGRIAQQHGCSVQDLQAWNSLSGTTIQPGQALRIRR